MIGGGWSRLRRAVATLIRGTNALDDVRMRCPDCGSALVNTDGLHRQVGLVGAIKPNPTQLRMHCPTHGRPPHNEPASG